VAAKQCVGLPNAFQPKHCVGQDSVTAKYFFNQNFVSAKCFSTKTLCGPNAFQPKHCVDQMPFNQNIVSAKITPVKLFGPKHYVAQKILSTKYYFGQILSQQKLCPPK
jgi:hypothetical protein